MGEGVGGYLTVDPDETGISFDTFIGRHSLEMKIRVVTQDDSTEGQEREERGVK